MLCKCVFSDSAQVLDGVLERLKNVQMAESLAVSSDIKQLKKDIRVLRRECRDAYKMHARYRKEFSKEMIEFSKKRGLNPERAPALRISTWTAGDLKEVRQPPKKKSKTKKQQNLNADGAVAPAATTENGE